MLSRKEFIQSSLETNLFFQRIIKEHMFFIQVNLPSVNSSEINEANLLKKSFEAVLAETVIFSNCAVRNEVLQSNEIVTPFTLRAEEISSQLSGASLNTEITEAEYDLRTDPNFNYTEWLEEKLYNINMRSINLLEEAIDFSKKLLSSRLQCKIFITLYPHLIEHTIRESELYMEILKNLQNKNLPDITICNELNFWNHIMEDHAEFIDGLLDPTEEDLKEIAEALAETFEKILDKKCNKNNEKEILDKSLKATQEIIDFKKASTEGLLACKIKSIIIPLLGDHVLREANHYLRILKEIK
ncbi:DUF2935 domain-containing protein [Tissierella praeacuta]|uniref:DUF2935 domain-containing protein n=1 Tax=Tissierella praeacuta DSM 18095 TaxID=1123404 RepID=A0A1M4W8V9_9FIRM|nr:DUF2935 domain-containing protein [Tissierella praeacuta]MBU5256095.1 DUF2935 domain-containing protein [Tissierella praeacuta]TCU75554.1 DUF2935 family protein [Tissierella praeacuta]SHE77639.1 protein of unknown function [Tissierella praeacuta DSM 18095]SUO99962.1 Domain of uncharacterised function (DUF2935) [Tissierella praeacuta]